MTPRPTRDVSALYHEQQTAGVFGDLRYGGDQLTLANPASVDPGRLELHQATEAEAARTGLSYEQALDSVLAQAKTGLRTLSQRALTGTGVQATRPGRDGLAHHPTTGAVIALSAGAAVSLAQPPEAPQDSARFKDAVAFCVSQRPGADRNSDAATRRLIERCDPATAQRQIDGWIQAGGGKVAGVRFG